MSKLTKIKIFKIKDQRKSMMMCRMAMCGFGYMKPNHCPLACCICGMGGPPM